MNIAVLDRNQVRVVVILTQCFYVVTGTPTVGEGDAGGEGGDGTQGTHTSRVRLHLGGVLPRGAVRTLPEPLHLGLKSIQQGPAGIHGAATADQPPAHDQTGKESSQT